MCSWHFIPPFHCDVHSLSVFGENQFEDSKRTKLRDINVYVSKTRLCVHNLPKFVDNKKLRAVCLGALKETKGVRIVEVRNLKDGRGGHENRETELENTFLVCPLGGVVVAFPPITSVSPLSVG